MEKAIPIGWPGLIRKCRSIFLECSHSQGRSQDVSKGGGVALCQNEGTHQIVMSFSPPVLGCLL